MIDDSHILDDDISLKTPFRGDLLFGVSLLLL